MVAWPSFVFSRLDWNEHPMKAYAWEIIFISNGFPRISLSFMLVSSATVTIQNNAMQYKLFVCTSLLRLFSDDSLEAATTKTH